MAPVSDKDSFGETLTANASSPEIAFLSPGAPLGNRQVPYLSDGGIELLGS
jgi:hypothetical protein